MGYPAKWKYSGLKFLSKEKRFFKKQFPPYKNKYENMYFFSSRNKRTGYESENAQNGKRSKSVV